MTTILFNTEITYNGMSYPRWLVLIGWGSCLSSIICIPIYFVFKLSKMNGSFKKVRQLEISRKKICRIWNFDFDCREYELHYGQIIGDRPMWTIGMLGKIWFEILENAMIHNFFCINKICVYIFFLFVIECSFYKRFVNCKTLVNLQFYFSVICWSCNLK